MRPEVLLASCIVGLSPGGLAFGGTVPPLANPQRLSPSEVVIDQPKYLEAGRKAVAFELEIKSEAVQSRLEGRDFGAYWRVRLPTIPDDDAALSITYRYLFEPTPSRKDELRSELPRFFDKATQTLVAARSGDTPIALGTDAYNEALTKEVEKLLASDKVLARFRTKEGQRAAVAALEKIGLEQNKEMWSVSERTIDRIAEYYKVKAYARPTSAVLNDFANSSTSSTITPSVSKECARAIEAGKAAKVEAARSLFDAIIEKCTKSLKQTSADKATVDKATAATHRSAKVTFAKTEAVAAFASLTPGYGKRPDLRALYLAVEGLHSLDVAKTAKQKLEALAPNPDTLLESFSGAYVTSGKAVLKTVKDRRKFDVSTGIVWASGIDDVFMPVMVSLCPIGCLRGDEHVWKDGNGWRLFSFDFGVRATAIGSVDPRIDGATAFVAGVSLNPISALRLSAGALMFENQRSDTWTARPYFGVTADLLTAAELLGPLGIGLPDLVSKTEED